MTYYPYECMCCLECGLHYVPAEPATAGYIALSTSGLWSCKTKLGYAHAPNWREVWPQKGARLNASKRAARTGRLGRTTNTYYLCKAAGGFIKYSLIYDAYCETEGFLGWDKILKTWFFALDHSIEYEIIGTSEKEFPSLNSLRRYFKEKGQYIYCNEDEYPEDELPPGSERSP